MLTSTDIYMLNSGTRVRTTAPESNDFSHDFASGCIFLVLESASRPGKTLRLFGTFDTADRYNPGDVLTATQDTGTGHRKMNPRRVVAVISADGVKGDLPSRRKLSYWVAK